ncbi:MAG: endonuclease/exonuclease/phosphatase family protein [Alphaproteobacteria bacterium]
MEVITYNIQYCLGRDGRFDAGRIVETIRDADVVALQEVERFWTRSDDMDQCRVIADALPSHYWMFGPTIDVLKSTGRGADAAVDNRRRQFGNMILSRFPILSSRNHLLPKYTDPEKFTIQRGALEATIDAPFGPIRVYSTHLCHLSAAQRLRQVETILAIHGRADADGAVHSGRTPDAWADETVSPPPPPADAMLLGDFNMQPDSPEYGRLVADAFADAWTRAGVGGDGATLYSDAATRRGIRIDYCFVTAGLGARLRRVEVLAEAAGSDHQPVRTTFDPD